MKYKWMLLILPLLIGVQSQAAIGDGDPTENLQNLVFYPHAKTFRLLSQVNGSLQNQGNTENQAGAQTNTTSNTYTQTSLALTYGLFPRARLEASETFLFDQTNTVQNFNNGLTTNNHSNGLSDPSFTFSYRYYEDISTGWYADSNLLVLASTGQKVAAASNQTGNNLTGGWTGSLLFPVYKYDGLHEFGVTPQISRNFGITSQGATTMSYTTPYWTTSLQLQYRYHVVPEFYVQTNLALNFAYSYTITNVNPVSHDVGFFITPSLNLGYLVRKWCLVSATVSYTNNQNSATPVSGNDTTASTSQTVATVAANFTF